MASPSPPLETTITYEELASIEHSFDQIDTQILSRQYLLTRPLYAKRRAAITKIPNFWPIALEQAPAEIDQFILPSDSEVLAALTSIELERPEVPSSLPKDGDSEDIDAYGQPRTFTLTFSFAPNDWFSDTALTKTFRYRRAKDGTAGLISDPVKINWKKGKDLTKGLLKASFNLFEAQKKAGTTLNSSALHEFQTLRKQLESYSEGAQSFFSFFGYRGRWISDEESNAADKKYKDDMKKRQEDPSAQVAANDEEEEEEEEVDMEDVMTEIFPEGETLATVFAEDFYPGAIKYFTSAQEADMMSDDGFEDMDDEDDDDDGEEMVDLRSLVKGYKGGNKNGPKKEQSESIGVGVEEPPKKKKRKN